METTKQYIEDEGLTRLDWIARLVPELLWMGYEAYQVKQSRLMKFFNPIGIISSIQ